MIWPPAKRRSGREFTKGIVKENPVLRLVLGTCATLAVSTAASNAIGMGLATTFVLVCSNAVISLLRKVIPDKVRIPSYITIIAGFVTIVQMFIQAYSPDLDKALGIYLPLIVVNCIILGRAEMFANKNPLLPSILDRPGHGRRFHGHAAAHGASSVNCWAPARCSASPSPLPSWTRSSSSSSLPEASLCSAFWLRLPTAFPGRARRRRRSAARGCPLAGGCSRLQAKEVL